MRLTTDDPEQRDLGIALAVLTQTEARELCQSLQYYFEDAEQSGADPGWHCHVGDGEGHELTIAIEIERTNPG